MHGHAQGFNLTPQNRTAAFVNLHRHEAWGKFDDMGFQAQIGQGFCRFQTQQTAANHHADFTHGGSGFHGFQVFDGAVNQAILTVMTWDGRYEGIRACR